MNSITFVLLVLFLISILLYLIIKKQCIDHLSKRLNNQDYSTVLAKIQTTIYQKLLGKYSCDLFEMRVYVLSKNNEKMDQKAKQIITQQIPYEQLKSFLELYFHVYLHRSNKEMVELFYQAIIATNDERFIRYNKYAYEIKTKKNYDFKEVIEVDIEQKLYKGFALGCVVYYLGYIYEMEGDLENAEIYYRECCNIIHPSSIYYELAKNKIRELRKA